MKDWQEYIKLPLKNHEDLPFWIVDSNNNHVLDCFATNEEIKKYLEVINSGSDCDGGFEASKSNACDIEKFGNVILRIRGWGYLTGSGVKALHLPQNEAIEIQNQFKDYILKQLNKN